MLYSKIGGNMEYRVRLPRLKRPHSNGRPDLYQCWKSLIANGLKRYLELGTQIYQTHMDTEVNPKRISPYLKLEDDG